MVNNTTEVSYATLLCGATTLKNFSSLAREFEYSRLDIASSVPSIEESQEELSIMSCDVFRKSKHLVLAIDTTMIKKDFATKMEGTEEAFCTKTQRVINSYTLGVAAITDGKVTMPLDSDFVFSKAFIDQCDMPGHSLADVTKKMILTAYVPDKKITAVCDGAFATHELFSWAQQNNVRLLTRMHSNRVIEYQGKRIKLSELITLKRMRPCGNRKGRSIFAYWNGIPLHITIERRIDKHGEETIVYLAATYQAEPRLHIALYKKRWNIEKLFRTAKQQLGLNDCQSKSLAVQHNHMMAVLVAYSKAQLLRIKYKLQTVEDALRACKEKFRYHQKHERCLPIESLAHAMA